MATCTQSAQDYLASSSYDSLTPVFPNTSTPFSTTAASNALFKLEIPSFQTIGFTFILGSAPYSSSVSILRYNGGISVSPVASVNLTTASTFFTADLTTGQYILCVRSNNTQAGSFVGQFTGYSQSARFDPSVASGEAFSASIKTFPKPRNCKEPLFFELVDGSLPPGLTIDSLGTIRGQLPNLDCLEDSPSPSINWWYTENDSTLWPWGRQWRFQVKLWIANQPDVFQTEWFCVKIHNNWDFDRDRFLAQSPFEHVESIRVLESPPSLPKSICGPCDQINPQEVMFVPQPVQTDCVACASPNQTTNIEMIPIPDTLCTKTPSELLVWFEEKREGDRSNPEIAKFIDNLSASESFNILRGRAGYVKPDPLSDRQKEMMFVSAENYQNFLQLSVVRLDPQADELAFLVDLWKNQENQALPITMLGHTGSTFEVSIL